MARYAHMRLAVEGIPAPISLAIASRKASSSRVFTTVAPIRCGLSGK
jgi:hypothetical protein